MSDFSKCPACGQVHDLLQPCAADSSLRVLDDVEFCAQPDPEWEIEHVTQQGSLEIGFGPSDAGKSTLYAGRACCLATGTDWIGMRVLRSGPVLVLLFEGRHAFRKKLCSWKAAHGFGETERIGVHVVEDHVNFLDRADVLGLLKAVERLGAYEVIVDTLAQSICADEENQQMQVAVNNAALIRRRTGARVVFIHHSGKNRKLGARGGTALTAAADTVLSLDEERDGERFAPVFLKLTKTPDGSTVLFERREGAAVLLLGDTARLHGQILTWLRAHPGATTDAIGLGVVKRKADVIKALVALFKAGQITSTKISRANGWSVEP